MINKQNLWFITLFSLILILGVYYVALPSDTIATLSDDNNIEQEVIEVESSDVIIAMKVEEEEKILKQMEDAQGILLNVNTSTEEKNEAYELLQSLNTQKGKVAEIEKLIKEKFELESCVKLEDNKINIVISSEDKGDKFANKVINEVQKLYKNQMYITIKFQK